MQESLYPVRTFGAWVTRKNPKSEIRNPKFYVKLYVGITDYDWFKLHASKAIVEEVSPSSSRSDRMNLARPFRAGTMSDRSPGRVATG